MSLLPHIQVNSRYTRSIHLERDSEGAHQPYVLTGRSVQVLGQVADALDSDPKPRAFALIGPYGSGKSAFALFLGRLLGNLESEPTQVAHHLLAGEAPGLAARYSSRLAGTRGYCVAVLTGSPEPLARNILRSLKAAAQRSLGGRRGRMPKVLAKIDAALASVEPDTSAVLAVIEALQDSLAAANGAGLLIVIDELGKFLEYEARHRGGSEIYLLQALAENALRAHEAPLSVVVLLHQSFELYAQSLGEQLRNEWKKVQGRYESVPFLETAEQTLRVVKAALIQDFDANTRDRIRREARQIACTLADLHALPSALDAGNAGELFADCYPLHPISLLLLPTLCQRVAQNERTLFSYLGSHEPHGFLDSLKRLHANADTIGWIDPAEIFDYFILNQPGLSADNLTRRRWAEVVTALERVGDASEVDVRLVKTIGLMNIVGAQGGLKPSPELLNLCGCPARVDAGLAALNSKSVITFRRYNGEYRVWQGSDFDLETALAAQMDQIGGLDIAELLNEAQPIAPIIARRHAIESGTLRYFHPVFVSGTGVDRIAPTVQPTLFIALAANIEESARFEKALKRLTEGHAIGVIAGNPQDLRDAVLTVEALNRIQRESGQLAGDPVAQKELKDRLAAARKAESAALISILESPINGDWFIHGRQVLLNTKRGLQTRLSQVFDEVYCRAPRLRNELINRDKPSASAIAGRNKLIAAMFEHAAKEDLGIDKYPAEKAMYRSLLRATGLHRCDGKGWTFSSPSDSDLYVVRPAWDHIEARLAETEREYVSVADLFCELGEPPFGIKGGAIPVFFLAYFLARQHELALFEEGRYLPFLAQDSFERLLKAPKAFSLQQFSLDDVRATLFRRYAEIIDGDPPVEGNLLAAAKPLARLMMNLPDYTKRTARLSKEAIAVRNLFFQAKSPSVLMLESLPLALGCGSLVGKNVEVSELEEFLNRFQTVIGELRSAYHRLLYDFQGMLKRAFRIDEKVVLHELRTVLHGRVFGLDRYTIDLEGLRAFLGRLVDPYGEEAPWLISVASFLARKPPEKWSDDDVQAVEHRIDQYSKRIRDLTHVRLAQEERAEKYGDGVEVILLRTVQANRGERDQFVTIDAAARRAVAPAVADVTERISTLPEELQMAALAMLIAQFDDVRQDDSGGAHQDADGAVL